MSATKLIILLLIIIVLFILASVGALPLASSANAATASAQTPREELREEFHQTYPLAPNGRVVLQNINGAVKITGWDRNEVKIDAVKRAYTPERLKEAKIAVESSGDALRVKTKYPFDSMTWRDDGDRRYDNPASVEYTLMIPRAARVDRIEVINGAVELENLSGDVSASSINGHVTARSLTGDVKLSTINSLLDASFAQLDPSRTITLDSVNGELLLTIPSDARAQLRASTVHGGIENDFNLPVRHGKYVGNDLASALGEGGERGARVRLNNVNGRIRIRRANDGKALSRATNLLPQTRDEYGNDRVDADIQREIEQASREAQRASEQALRDAQRAIRESQLDNERIRREVTREMQQNMAQMAADIARSSAEMAQGVAAQIGGAQRTERESKSFAVGASPYVVVHTFDGAVMVRSWDKQEVAFETVKRAPSDDAIRRIKLNYEQRGNEISLVAEFDKSVKSYNNTTAQIEVFVPRQANVRVQSGDGRLLAEDVAGAMELHTGDGRIEVRGGRGSLKAETGDGRIVVSNFDGAVEAKTGDGRITLEGRFSQLSARTNDGSISLTIPSDAGAFIEVADSDAKKIVNDGFSLSAESSANGRTRRLRLGNGGGVYTLHTGDGQIFLRRADGLSVRQ